ncbi:MULTISPECIES: hypothetical protein [unclassified Streptomyces]|uniref:hypothetical protein n=1 Tax=unclassified Streptomyces TaxID=2593676 RepID=UPI0035D78348
MSGRGVAELVLEKGLLPAERRTALLRPEILTGSGTTPARPRAGTGPEEEWRA